MEKIEIVVFAVIYFANQGTSFTNLEIPCKISNLIETCDSNFAFCNTTTNKCQCYPTFEVDSHGTCRRKSGISPEEKIPCDKADFCNKVDVLRFCNTTSKTCECIEKTHVVNGKCEFNKGTVLSDIKCQNGRMCRKFDKYSACTTKHKCKCTNQAHFVGEKCQLLSGHCLSNRDCKPHSICNDQSKMCNCTDKYKSSSNGSCILRKHFCVQHEDCKFEPNTYCNLDEKECQCIDRYKMSENETCELVKGYCKKDTDCYEENSECNFNGICQCMSYTTYNGKNCLKLARKTSKIYIPGILFGICSLMLISMITVLKTRLHFQKADTGRVEIELRQSTFYTAKVSISPSLPTISEEMNTEDCKV